MDWRTYQEETASVFRSLGCKALVEETLEGARGDHDIDVLVTFEKFGVTSTWIVECKFWESAVPKEKVLALQAIVDDVGADRGILVSKTGFQSGAIKQASKSNITLTSLEEFAESAYDDFREIQVEALEVKLIKMCSLYKVLTNPSEEHRYGFLKYGFDGNEAEKTIVFNYYLQQAHKSMQDLKLGTENYSIFTITDYLSLNMNYSPQEIVTQNEDELIKFTQELVHEAWKWLEIKKIVART
ncbi:TPA: restriction endonuclease [Vibrio diabolicus]